MLLIPVITFQKQELRIKLSKIMSIMSPVTGVEVSLTVSIRESSLVSLSENSYSILLSLVSIGP